MVPIYFARRPSVRAGHHGVGHLAARRMSLAQERNLAAIGGKVRNNQYSVGGVEANTDTSNSGMDAESWNAC